MSLGQTPGQTGGMVIGGIVGGIIGGYPGAMLGMSIGGQLGLWIDPPNAPPPPPLGDLDTNSYVRSTPVALCFGQNKVYGGIIWVGDLESDWNNEGSRKNPEWSPKMTADFAVAHCEGEIISFTGLYYIDDKRAGTMEEEGYHVSLTNFVGSATQSISSVIAAFQAPLSLAAINFKYTCYSVVHLKVEGQILQKLPSISVEVKGFNTETGEEDANPIRSVFNFLTDSRFGIGMDLSLFNGDPDTPGSPWQIESDYCDETVQYTSWDDSLVNEARFRYSNVFDTRSKAVDIITDMLITCRGLLRVKQGKIEPLIEKDTETPEVYYSDQKKETFTVNNTSTVNRIYADFSDYPDGFWFGDEGDITISDIVYRFIVKAQTSTYIDLFDDLPVTPNVDDDFVIVKDNIKEGSFNFNLTPDSEISNRFRVEFVERSVKDESDEWHNDYSWNVVEKDREEFYIDNDQPEKIKTIRLGGIKRKSQAMRMIQFFSDCSLYNRAYCEFIVGVQGYYHAIGDLIGVSHTQTGWYAKSFRIVGMEEMESDEIKFQCLEYNNYVYSDVITKVLATEDMSVASRYVAPDVVERFYAVKDLSENKIYILFKRPDGNPYFVGARVYVSADGGDYKYKKTIGYLTSSVKLASGIDDSQTTIAFDNSTLYGTFPDSGSFWIENELITYTSIDDINHEFEGCTRGGNASAHTSDKYCMLKDENTEYITFEDSEIGQSWTIKPVSITVYNLTANFTSSPTKVVTIS